MLRKLTWSQSLYIFAVFIGFDVCTNFCVMLKMHSKTMSIWGALKSRGAQPNQNDYSLEHGCKVLWVFMHPRGLIYVFIKLKLTHKVQDSLLPVGRKSWEQWPTQFLWTSKLLATLEPSYLKTLSFFPVLKCVTMFVGFQAFQVGVVASQYWHIPGYIGIPTVWIPTDNSKIQTLIFQ